VPTATAPAGAPLSFADLGVPEALAGALRRGGITSPFSIQTATLPDALAGRDLSGRAPTGSGKTLAFGLPLLARLGRARPGRPRALVLVPTRELASQVSAELAALARSVDRTVLAVYGGVGMEGQRRVLRRGADVIVATPGRLTDLVNRRDIDLGDVDIVVIDEADRMADMGFLPEVRRLLDATRSDRQTLLFSATLDGEVDVLVRHYQRDPVRHELAPTSPAADNTHVFWRVERTDRVTTLGRVIDRFQPTIVFCRTKRGADRLSRQLNQLGLRTAAIHGDRSQSQRERALADFSNGRTDALVATDVAARGIHVDAVACVVHYDPPGSAKDYTHRSGRTGRAGARGLVLSLVPGELARDTARMRKELALPGALVTPDLQALSDVAPPAAPRRQPVAVTTSTPATDAAPSSARRHSRRPTSSGGQGRPRGQGARTNGAPSGGGQPRRRPRR